MYIWVLPSILFCSARTLVVHWEDHDWHSEQPDLIPALHFNLLTRPISRSSIPPKKTRYEKKVNTSLVYICKLNVNATRVFPQPVLSGFMHHSTSFASVLYIWIKELVLVIAQFTVAFRMGNWKTRKRGNGNGNGNRNNQKIWRT